MARVNVNMFKVWLSKPDVYPLVAAVAFGVSFGVYKGTEHLFNPDVQLAPERRSADALDKYSPEEGEAWRHRVMRHYRHKDDSLRNLSIFEVLTPSWWQHRKEVNEHPEQATAGGRTQLQ